MSPRKVVGLGAIALVALLFASTWDVTHSIHGQAQEPTMESVALTAGCNPVAITYPDNTPIATIAGAVSPSEILIAIWKFENARAVWSGFSPSAPAEVNDLTEMDRLDVGFLCVDAPGTFTRPEI